MTFSRLSHVAEVSVSTVDKHTVEGEVPVRLCNYVDVYKNNAIVDGLIFMSATATPDEIRRFSIAPGDTLFTKDSETADDIGVPAYVQTSSPLVCGYHVAIARPSERAVHPRYLYWSLASSAAAQQWQVLATGVTRVGLRQSDIGKLSIWMPDLQQQAVIADFLDRETAKIDALLGKQDALVARLREHHRSANAQAVESVLDLESGARLKHFVTEMRQGWSPQCESVPADGVTEWGVLKTGCVNGGVFRPQENKLLPADAEPRVETVVRRGEIVMSRASTRDLVGSAAVVEADYPRLMLSDKTYAITVDRRVADPWFVSSFLGTPRIRQAIELEATGASHSMQNVSKEDLLNLPMPLPHVESQVEVARALAADAPKVDAMVAKAQELSSKLRERRAALITAAVTGKLDVTTYGKAG
ncbi:restriction endonuclease subunit S [Serinicoccus kebangsaanensis]|uniref:restriction endonuclease subunit S n=1 Tax=Serinicoccus kebangsaanensis TaxID=2602069 RepID=UPI00124E2851|nr:restriction endonuclease subunit S [Serinicoccus kebangsaanensis]